MLCFAVIFKGFLPVSRICPLVTSPSSPWSRKAVAMLFWTALIQACRSFSESACRMQLLLGQRNITQLLSTPYVETGPCGATFPALVRLHSNLLGGGHNFEAKATLYVLTVFDGA